jgi:D-3-phosphoglycerate dehydrogenase
MKVLLNKPIYAKAVDVLQEKVTLLTPYTASADKLRTQLVQADAILLSAGFTVGAQEMDLAPKLRVVGRHGVGLDNVDVEAATERGILVTYTPYGPTESTAEHAFLLILATARRLPLLDRATRAGDFGIRTRSETMGIELEGKTLGIVGFGRIGRRVAEMCRAALDMAVYVYDPYLDPQVVIDWGATPVQDLVDLAGQVDVLSLHIPATDRTHHLVDETVIQALGPRAILINAARGAVLDEAALVQALEAGRIYGAGIDVYDPEPPESDNPLFQLDQVVLTPHVASRTTEGRKLMGMTAAEDILEVLQGNKPKYLANPEVWPNRRFAQGTD